MNVVLAAIAQRLAPALPTAAPRAAFQRPDGVKELVAGVHLPMRWFSTTGDDDAGADSRLTRAGGQRSREVHGEGDRTDHAVRVIKDAHELSQIGLADQVVYPPQGRVEVIRLP